MNLLKTALIAVSFIVYPLSYAQDEIGVAAAVNTKTIDMVAYPGGSIENRNIDPGYKIISNRTIQTNKSGKAQMLLVDGTAFTIGPNSTVTLDKFIYDPATASGSLEVSAKGLVRLVGGKVTKKRPAIIKTSTATVGIRGGIAIVEASPEETKASFVYGVEMEVAPLENPDNSLVLTQVGLSVEVEAGSDEVEDPEVITSEELDDYSDDFEGNEEPEDESDSEESENDSSESDEESEASEDSEESEEESEETEESEESEEESEETEESEESEEESEETEESEESEEESQETEESDESEEESQETEDAEETDENDEVEEESEETEESDEVEDTESEEVEEEADSENVDDSEESNDSSPKEDTSETDETDSNQSSDSETQDDENSSDASNDSQEETTPQESTDTEDEPSDNNTAAETTSSDEDPTSNDSSETSVIDTDDDSQEQSSNNVESNDGVANETTSSDTSGNTTDSDSANDQLSQGSESEVETQPTSNENQSPPDVQRPTATSTSSSDEASPPTQPNQGREIKDTPLTRPAEEPTTSPSQVTTSTSSDPVTVTQPVTATSSSDSVPLVQPSTSTSSSDSVPLVQPPTTTSSSDSVPLIQPPVATSSTETITLEPLTQETDPVIPEIDESLLDNFDISKNTSDTGIDDLTTAYDQGGELFFDDTQIETQEEEFIEEATEANEEVQIEEVQQEQKVEVVIEAQLSASTSFIKNDIEEDLSIGSSLGKIDVNYTGSEELRFVLGGNGSENFEIDNQGNIILKNNLDYEARQSYDLLVFTFLGDKSITNDLKFKVVDIDEDPVVDLNLLVNSLAENTATSFKIADIQIDDPEKNGISTSISGVDSAKVSISNSGEITLKESLDFETKENLEFVVSVFDGKNIVEKPISIQISNINDLTASVNLSSNQLHEGADIDSTVANINVVGDSTLKYSILGTDSSDFSVSSDGKIKLAKTLSYSSKNIYDLKLKVEGRNDSVEVPFTVIIKENEAPVISPNCLNGCSFDELTSIGTTLVESSRQDNDGDSISYGLVNDFGGKFSIDQNTGKVSLSNKLDFESQNSYTLQVRATDSKNLTDTKSVSLSVGNINIAPSASFNTDSVAVSKVNNIILIEEDIDEINDSNQKILQASSNFTDSSSTFSLSGPDASKFEINNLGEVRAKDLSNASSSGGIDVEAQRAYNITVTESRPDEPDGSQNITMFSQNVEDDAASVARYSGAFNSDSRVRFKASADRGVIGTQDNKAFRETILSKDDLARNNGVTSVSSKGHMQVNSGKIEVFSSTIENGNSENDVTSSDWKYEFPIDTDSSEESINTYAPNHDKFNETASFSPIDNDPTQNIIERVNQGNYYEAGEGIQTVLTHKLNVSGSGKVTNLQLPQNFTYYGDTFTHINVSENGYIKFSTNSSVADDVSGWQHGVPLMYLFDAADYDTANGWPDSYQVPIQYRGSNLSNTLFPIWSYFRAEANEKTDIRTLWNPTTKNYVIGFYNLSSTDHEDNKVNVEVVLNTVSGEIKFIYGDFGSNFQKFDSGSNTMIGISGDLSQSEYTQIYYCDQNEDCSNFGENDATSTFADHASRTTDRGVINSLYNSSLFTNHGAKKITDFSTLVFSPNGGSAYNFSYNDVTSNSFLNATDDGSLSGPTFTKSEITSSGRQGNNFNFLWMNLDKSAVNISYRAASESNPGGYNNNSPNYKDGSFGTADYANASYNLLEDQITIAGIPYSTSDFRKLITQYGSNSKRVVAFAPIPIEYTSKRKNPNLESLSYTNDKEHLKYFLPQFFSTDYLDPQFDGSDKLFDFDVLQENDYCQIPGSLNCTYAVNDLKNRDLQRPSSSVNASSAYNDNYSWVSTALSGQGTNEFIKTNRFSGSNNYVPEGQSLWYQVFKPTGKGVGLFVQLNFNCESGGPCSSAKPSYSTQSSYLSILLSDTDSRSNMPGYYIGDTGLAISGSQYFSYQRKSSRNITNDGELAVKFDTPQIAFGITPISCASTADYGCFWGENTSSSNWISPTGAMITSSDPYRGRNDNDLSGNMTLGVMHAMSENNSQQPNAKNYQVGTFNQAVVKQNQIDTSGAVVDSISLDNGSNSWRGSVVSSSDSWNGFINGFLNIDDGYTQSIEGELQISFDGSNDRLKAVSNDIQFYKLPFLGSSGQQNTWFRTGANSTLLPTSYGTQSAQNLDPKSKGHFVLQFGDDEINNSNNDFARSAYINKKVFAASLKDDNKVIRFGESNLQDNVISQTTSDKAGALVSWETLDNPDKDYISTGTNIPDLDYMSWGFWAMATNDIADNLYNGNFSGAGEQTAAVHLGTWLAGDLLDPTDIPVNYQATMVGAAIFNVFTRLNDSSYSYTASGKAEATLDFSSTGSWNGTMVISEADKFGPDAYKNWSASFNLGNNSSNKFNKAFTCDSAGGSSVCSALRGALYGTKSNLEMGTQFIYSKESQDSIYMAEGISVLSD